MSGFPAFPTQFFTAPQNSQQAIEGLLMLPFLPLIAINQYAIAAQESLAGQTPNIPIVI